jgi:hypothetical protein
MQENENITSLRNTGNYKTKPLCNHQETLKFLYVNCIGSVFIVSFELFSRIFCQLATLSQAVPLTLFLSSHIEAAELPFPVGLGTGTENTFVMTCTPMK